VSPKNLRTQGAYIVQFDQRAAKFIYPDHAPFDDDEIVLRICNTTPWKRYRLIFGSKTVGSDAMASTTVGYAATEVDAALRGANAILANDHTCNDRAVTGLPEKPGDKQGDDLTAQCLRLRNQVSSLVWVAEEVMRERDGIATMMAECGSRRDPRAMKGEDSSYLKQRCGKLFLDGDDYPEYDIGTDVNGYLDQIGVSAQIAWIDDTWHIVDRNPVQRKRFNDDGTPAPDVPLPVVTPPSLRSNPGEGVLPATIIGYLNTRAELVTAIQRAMDGYSKLAALSLRIREDLARRQTTFRLGRFAGNRIVVATLEEHTVRVGFTQDRKRLQFSTEIVPHQLSLTVQGTSYVQFDIGIAYSSADGATYGPSVQTVGGMPTEVVQRTGDGHDLNPVLFASFLWCAQSLERPWISRSCRDGSRDIRWWFPRFAFGLPLSADLGRGSAYLGASVPVIPYVSLIGGVNAQRVQKLSGIREGDPVPSGGIPTSTELKWGWFASVGVTEEIFHLLVPQVEAAK
jgi:hypothetical protein